MERNFEPLPPRFSKVVSDLVPAGSSSEQQSQQPQQPKRTEQAGQSSVEKSGKRSEKQANYNTSKWFIYFHISWKGKPKKKH